jgi:acyl-CoA synthetase (AMP-forming)/AMP-acid ligase II
VLRNVFEQGDEWFRSGDLMLKDVDGFIYFVDRLGDTFRWKGENCSCAQVEEAIVSVGLVEDVAVYGVVVPGNDGRAGMACLMPKKDLEANIAAAASSPPMPLAMKDFYSFVAFGMATWQMPLFLRIDDASGNAADTPSQLALTATFKHNKTELKRVGFNKHAPEAARSSFFVRDDASETYVPLTDELYDAIMAGRLRL